MGKGLDISQSPSANFLAEAKAQGFEFICRYYSHNANKNLSLWQASSISKAGFEIVTVWEAGNTPDYFTEQQGTLDAKSALAQATACRQPPGSTIYFAVDLDAQNLSRVIDYFTAIRALVFPKYNVGVYGSGTVIKALFDNGVVEKSWLAMSKGWGGYDPDGKNIVQSEGGTIANIDYDADTSDGDAGGWIIT